MRSMKKMTGLVVLMLMVLGISACIAGGQTSTEPSGEVVKLTPYHTATLTPTDTPTPQGLPTNTPIPTVTATPQVYEVKANDTLIGIAVYFGLTLEELQAANPGVQPALLTIGTKLTIPAPIAKNETVSVVTPVTYDVTIGAPDCTLSLTGGFHCFALVENGEEIPLENLTAEITLTDPVSGEEISQQVLLPLSRLAPGTSLPFYTYFAPPVVPNATTSARILTVTEARSGDNTVFPLVINIDEVSIPVDGASAKVTGTAALEEVGSETSFITLVAVAYDAAGRVIGMRRVAPQLEWGSEGNFEFEITVYSIGGIIDRVEVLGEAGK